MNANELRAEIARHGETCGILAKALGFSNQTMTSRLKGEKDFTRKEIKIIKDRYNLSPERIVEIFLS